MLPSLRENDVDAAKACHVEGTSVLAESRLAQTMWQTSVRRGGRDPTIHVIESRDATNTRHLHRQAAPGQARCELVWI
jgi:hypothetical protein